MSGWVPFFSAMAGASVGGGFAVGSGWLNQRRTERRAHVDRVLEQGAALVRVTSELQSAEGRLRTAQTAGEDGSTWLAQRSRAESELAELSVTLPFLIRETPMMRPQQILVAFVHQMTHESTSDQRVGELGIELDDISGYIFRELVVLNQLPPRWKHRYLHQDPHDDSKPGRVRRRRAKRWRAHLTELPRPNAKTTRMAAREQAQEQAT